MDQKLEENLWETFFWKSEDSLWRITKDVNSHRAQAHAIWTCLSLLICSEHPTILLLQDQTSASDQTRRPASQSHICRDHAPEWYTGNIYLQRICFSDEATFHVSGAVNRHNLRIWAQKIQESLLNYTEIHQRSMSGVPSVTTKWQRPYSSVSLLWHRARILRC